jgi:hypothetical protein
MRHMEGWRYPALRAAQAVTFPVFLALLVVVIVLELLTLVTGWLADLWAGLSDDLGNERYLRQVRKW